MSQSHEHILTSYVYAVAVVKQWSSESTLSLLQCLLLKRGELTKIFTV